MPHPARGARKRVPSGAGEQVAARGVQRWDSTIAGFAGMRIKYGYRIEIVCARPTPLIAMLDIHPSRRSDIAQQEAIGLTSLADGSHLRPGLYQDQFGNICRRVIAPAGGLLLSGEGVLQDTGLHDPQQPGARAIAPENLPDETLVYLLGSRYCETDQLGDRAWAMFGGMGSGWATVSAICDYVHDLIRFDYAQARNTRTAVQAMSERVGVCRDFAHLAIALCRCLNIPARYCTGYLGDIGVPADPAPMDFSAWFEVWLDNRWWTFDARHNIPRIGRVVIARGRDATDVPIINSLGVHALGRFEVVTQEVEGDDWPAGFGAEQRHLHAYAHGVETGMSA